jgi:hypothetical protein
MKFREFLRENTEKHAVMAFGRMNPPTTGHAKLVDKVKEVSKKVGGSHHVVVSHSTGDSKNPLTPAQKLKHAKRFFPNTNITVSDKEHPNFLTQAAKLHKQGVSHLHMVAGSDRIPEYKRVLKKYNGTHPDALFNFKKITIHSAGERDPDAEGTEGMSASKMRAHASSNNFKEFKKGVPAHVPEHHARELFNDVRKNTKLKEEVSLDEEIEEILEEGVHDKSIFKAVFLAGGPGSGKDYVLDNTLAGHGLTEINSDKALEFLMDKNNLDKTMPSSEADKRDIVRNKAKSITELRQRLALLGRNGLIINGTGDDHEKIKRIKERLEEIGYDTSMIMVNTDDEVSKQRNIERGSRGGRTVPEEIRKKKWDSVQAARPELAKLFGQNYMEFDNSEDLRQAPPEVVKAKKGEMLQLYKNVQAFVTKQPESENAQEWVAGEMQKKDTLPIQKGGAEMTPHPESLAADEAKKLGLQYYGFGRYGQNGEVTHRSVHDKLVEISKEQPKQPNIPVPGSSMKKPEKKVNEDFENFISESYTLSDSSAMNLLLLGNSVNEVDLDIENFEEENKKVKLLRDRNGQVRTFMLRRAAAKEAHTKDGTVVKYKNGYVVKIQEENENVQTISKPIQEQTISGFRARNTRETSGITEARSCGATKGESCDCGCGSIREETSSKSKITLKQIRSKQKEKVIESIDKGIEPGLSMAGAGESPARDMGEKWKKKTGKASQVAETIGDGGEVINSMSAEKEDSLKKKGINLASFKSNKAIGA